jgi:hypothetical protein
MDRAAWIDKYGSPNEKGRFAAGFLSDEGLSTVVYRALWDAFGGRFYKRQRLDHNDVEKLAVERGQASTGQPVTFEQVERADALTAQEWDVYSAIEKVAKEFDAQVQPFWIFACCGGMRLKRSYARVSVQVGDDEFKVELCLDARDARPDEPTLPESVYQRRPVPRPEVYKKR